MFDQRPIFVATTAATRDAERHVVYRSFVVDRLEQDERHGALVRSWGGDELLRLAEVAGRLFDELVAQTGDGPDDVVVAKGGLVGTRIHGPNGSAMDVGSERSAGPAEYVAIRLDPATQAIVAPLAAALRALEERWDARSRYAAADALIVDVGLGRWPFLAADVVRRYLAELESIVRGARRSGAGRHTPVGDDQLGDRQRAGWLFEHEAGISSYRTLAERDLGSPDPWRQVAREVNRVKAYLDLADSRWTPDPVLARS